MTTSGTGSSDETATVMKNIIKVRTSHQRQPEERSLLGGKVGAAVSPLETLIPRLKQHTRHKKRASASQLARSLLFCGLWGSFFFLKNTFHRRVSKVELSILL